jgi:hypothetical protein
MKKLIFILVLAFSGMLSAQTYTHYWVDIEAADTTGDGSAFAPFKYLNQVRYVMDSYTVIRIKDGDYNLEAYDTSYALSTNYNYLGVTASMSNIKIVAEGLDVYIYSTESSTSPLIYFGNNVYFKGIKFGTFGTGTGIVQKIKSGPIRFQSCSFDAIGNTYTVYEDTTTTSRRITFYDCQFNDVDYGIIGFDLDGVTVTLDHCTIGNSTGPMFRKETQCDTLTISNSIIDLGKIEKDSDAMTGEISLSYNIYEVSDHANYAWSNSLNQDSDATMTWDSTTRKFVLSTGSAAKGTSPEGIDIGAINAAIEGAIK